MIVRIAIGSASASNVSKIRLCRSAKYVGISLEVCP